MYTRYIPQSDGTYRRSRVPDPAPPPKSAEEPQPCPPPEPERPPAPPMPRQPKCPRRDPPPQREQKRPQREQEGGITGFLRQLLPRDLDTGDLLVVLLLLLMAGDCGDDQNTALLTLVLYLFL